jgi:hypothetical protein
MAKRTKKKISNHEVGDLLLCRDDDLQPVLGIITNIDEENYNRKMYDIDWVDGYTADELWDEEQIETFKSQLKIHLADKNKNV